MNTEEMFKLLLEGEKISHTDWSSTGYIQLKGGMLINEYGELVVDIVLSHEIDSYHIWKDEKDHVHKYKISDHKKGDCSFTIETCEIDNFLVNYFGKHSPRAFKSLNIDGASQYHIKITDERQILYSIKLIQKYSEKEENL